MTAIYLLSTFVACSRKAQSRGLIATFAVVVFGIVGRGLANFVVAGGATEVALSKIDGPFVVGQGQTLVVDAPGWLANDSDAEGDLPVSGCVKSPNMVSRRVWMTTRSL